MHSAPISTCRDEPRLGLMSIIGERWSANMSPIQFHADSKSSTSSSGYDHLQDTASLA